MTDLNFENIDITYDELADLPPEGLLLVDVRSESDTGYGMIPGAVWISQDEIAEKVSNEESRIVVIYCTHGRFSKDIAETLRVRGIKAFSLKGGYMSWLMADMKRQKAQMNDETLKKIERSLIKNKRFRKNIWCRFTKAIRTYELVKEGDRICVCISGGKDSMLMAKCFQELKKHNQCNFEVKFLVMDPGYSPENRQLIEDNLKKLNIPAEFYDSDIFDSVFNIEKNPCYLCARMRRGHLYSYAQKMGCNKIALGHHYDDVIETILMGMLYGAQIQTMMPKLHSTNFEGMELIRPLYLVREEDIKAWRDYNELRFIQCACKFTATCSITGDNEESKSKRQEVKRLIRELKKTNEFVEGNIFKSVENVHIDTVIGYKQKGVRRTFLDDYDTIS